MTTGIDTLTSDLRDPQVTTEEALKRSLKELADIKFALDESAIVAITDQRGIAHDLNNVLSPILMAVQMLELKAKDESTRQLLEILRTNAERGGNMVRQVLSFARGVEGERVALQPKHLIKEIVKIMRETLPKSIANRFHALRTKKKPNARYQTSCGVWPIGLRKFLTSGQNFSGRGQSQRLKPP